MEKFESSQSDMFEVVSLETGYRNIKSLPVWVIYPREDAER